MPGPNRPIYPNALKTRSYQGMNEADVENTMSADEAAAGYSGLYPLAVSLHHDKLWYDTPDQAAQAAVAAIQSNPGYNPYRENGVYITRNLLGKYGYTNAVVGDHTEITADKWDKIATLPFWSRRAAMLHFHPDVTGSLRPSDADWDIAKDIRNKGWGSERAAQYIYPQEDGQLRYWDTDPRLNPPGRIVKPR